MYQRGSLQEVKKSHKDVEFRVYCDPETGMMIAELRSGGKFQVRKLYPEERIGQFKYSNLLVVKDVYVIRSRVA